MAYNNAIPQPGDKLKNSQSDILGNFAEIKTLIDINHETFGSANEGAHKWVTFPVQIAAPLLAGDNGFYNVNDFGGTNKDEIWVHSQKSAGTTDIPMTASWLSNNAPVNDSSGWTYLPSGILLHWEYSVAPFNGLTTITVNPAYPAFNHIFSVIITPQNANIALPTQPIRLVDILSNTQFRVYSNGLTGAIMLIIGN